MYMYIKGEIGVCVYSTKGRGRCVYVCAHALLPPPFCTFNSARLIEECTEWKTAGANGCGFESAGKEWIKFKLVASKEREIRACGPLYVVFVHVHVACRISWRHFYSMRNTRAKREYSSLMCRAIYSNAMQPFKVSIRRWRSDCTVWSKMSITVRRFLQIFLVRAAREFAIVQNRRKFTRTTAIALVAISPR